MKKLTVLCMLGLFVLISANTDSIAAPREDTVKKCNDGKDNDGDGLIDFGDVVGVNDPDCNDVGEDPGGGGGGGDTYQMVFSGALPGGSNGDTAERFSANALGVGTVHEEGNTRIDLTHFADLPVHAGGDGDTCFGGGVGFLPLLGDHTFIPAGVTVTQGRRGRAEASVVFKALTANGDPAIYSLHTSGYFKDLPSGWPPSEVSDALTIDGVGNKDAIVRMTSWEMLLKNHTPSVLMGACLSDGDWPVEIEWQIEVCLGAPPSPCPFEL